MLLTILKIIAGLAVLGVISMILVAVISGIAASVRALKKNQDQNGPPGID
jgi:hypothetical protein